MGSRWPVDRRTTTRFSDLYFCFLQNVPGPACPLFHLFLFPGKVVYALSKCHPITIPWPESRAAQLHAPISSHEPSIASLVDWRISLEAGTTITARWQIPRVSVQP